MGSERGKIEVGDETFVQKDAILKALLVLLTHPL